MMRGRGKTLISLRQFTTRLQNTTHASINTRDHPTAKEDPKPKKDFANIGDFEKAFRKWEVESHKENEDLTMMKIAVRTIGSIWIRYMMKFSKHQNFLKSLRSKRLHVISKGCGCNKKRLMQLEAKKKEEARLAEVARRRLVALPNEGVDLDEDDDAVDFLNKSYQQS